MENQNKNFNSKELQHYETEYFNKLIKFKNENKDKTEIDFVKNELNKIEVEKTENTRIYNLSDEDFYKYLIIQNNKYKRELDESKDKEETKRLIFNNHLKREKDVYAPTFFSNRRKEFYEIKLHTIQSEFKQKAINPDNIFQTNQYQEIFSNNGFGLFTYILENFISSKGKRGRYADLSFFYWSMYNNIPQHIHQRPEVFKNWFCKVYEDSFNKIKTYNEVIDQKGTRKKQFQTALDWFKTQK